MACFIAYHGWGFDHTCWSDWLAYFQQQKHQFYCFDRGYFGQSHSPEFLGDRPYILILHSFGLHLCPVTMITSADIVVIFNSFLSFHPIEPRLQRRSRLTLQRMIDRFQTHPHETLQAFWHNCEVPEKQHPESMSNANVPLLQQDLTRLNETDLTLQSPTVAALQQGQTVWVIHSDRDKIVPMVQGATLADAVATSRWIKIPGAGHALPFSQPDHCWTLPPFTTL